MSFRGRPLGLKLDQHQNGAFPETDEWFSSLGTDTCLAAKADLAKSLCYEGRVHFSAEAPLKIHPKPSRVTQIAHSKNLAMRITLRILNVTRRNRHSFKEMFNLRCQEFFS